MKTNPPVVLFGSDYLTGLQTARILWRRQVPVIGVANNPRAPFCQTRAVVRAVPFAGLADDPLPLLRELRTQYGARPVVLACTDEFVWWLNDHREAVGEEADFLLAPSDTLRLLADKTQFYRYAIKHKLPLPPTRFIKNTEELEQAAREMTFPLLLKPARHTPEWMNATGGFKVLKVDKAEALLQTAPALQPVAGELILQNWVRGPDANMHSLYICMNRQSEPLACIVAKKTRQWPPDVGCGSLAVEVREDAVVEPGLEMLKRLGYAGPGSFQFKKDEEDGRFYIIEMNAGRPALNFPLCEACGVEMIYTYYCAAAGRPLPENRTITRPGSKWIYWKTDLASALLHWKRGDLTIRGWFASIRGHKWSAGLQLDDPVPQLADMGRKVLMAARGASGPARTLFMRNGENENPAQKE